MNGEERLQDWLPEERATYYIIKDYRRMYGECFYAKKMMRKAAREVEKVTKRNKELEAKYYKILNDCESGWKDKYECMRFSRDKYKEKYKKLRDGQGWLTRWLSKYGL